MTRSLCLFALALALAGCVTVRAVATPGSDLGRYRRFAFSPTTDADQAEFGRSPVGRTIRRGVADALVERGIVQDDQQPQFWVSCYFVVAEHETAPYASPMGPLYWAAPGTSRYMGGTVVVDFIDPTSGEVFWRGTASSLVSHPENPDPPKVAAGVKQLMRRYPAPEPSQQAAAGGGTRMLSGR